MNTTIRSSVQMDDIGSSPMADTPMVDVRGVWKVFGRRVDEAMTMVRSGATRAEVQQGTGCTVAVADVTFSVGRGETFVVMGLSGSGKSTLIRCVSRLVEPTIGSIHVDGRDLCAMNRGELRAARRSLMSMVFQHFGLFPHKRVVDNVAYGLEVQGVPRAERRATATEMLAKVGLDAWGAHYPAELSGGMQQRVGLARALAVNPQVLLFDEPFSALDPLIRRDMQDELLRLQREEQRTLLFITHDFAEAIRLGDRIAIMKDGVIDQIGTAAELVTAPATDYVREFTRDISAASVITAGSMTVTSDERCEHQISAGATIASVAGLLTRYPGAVEVVGDNGVRVGVLDRARAAHTLSDNAAGPLA